MNKNLNDYEIDREGEISSGNHTEEENRALEITTKVIARLTRRENELLGQIEDTKISHNIAIFIVGTIVSYIMMNVFMNEGLSYIFEFNPAMALISTVVVLSILIITNLHDRKKYKYSLKMLKEEIDNIIKDMNEVERGMAYQVLDKLLSDEVWDQKRYANAFMNLRIQEAKIDVNSNPLIKGKSKIIQES